MSTQTSASEVMRPEIILFGEILFDHFPDGVSVLGGAPFNVAWHLQALDAKPLLLSRIGDDGAGQRIREAMEQWRLEPRGVQIDTQHATGSVHVALEAGEPVFSIAPEQAYDYIEAAPALAAVKRPGILYHGTLAVRHDTSRRALDALIEASDPEVFVDVNLRTPWWQAYQLPGLLERATWIKLNQAELEAVTQVLGLSAASPREQARALCERCGTEYVVITCGDRGAFAVSEAGQEFAIRPEGDIPVVDAVGAGDAFSAVLLLGLRRGWPLSLSLKRAQKLAGKVCGIRGAVSCDDQFYALLRQDWGLEDDGPKAAEAFGAEPHSLNSAADDR